MFKYEIYISDVEVSGVLFKRLPNISGIADKFVLDLLRLYNIYNVSVKEEKGYLLVGSAPMLSNVIVIGFSTDSHIDMNEVRDFVPYGFTYNKLRLEQRG